MFSREVVESDDFLDLPLSAQGLYLHICMEADDDGFVNKANRIRRVVGASEEDYHVLLQRGYLLRMDKGLVVVAHWRICNTIRKDRYKPTVHQSEYKKLKISDDVYTLDSMGEKLPEEPKVFPNNYAEKFEEFWKAYPRKEHRALAEQEYTVLMAQGISADMLIASAKAYAKDKQDTEPKYINCPDTWLKKGIFTDYEVKEEPIEEELESVEEEPAMDYWTEKDGED